MAPAGTRGIARIEPVRLRRGARERRASGRRVPPEGRDARVDTNPHAFERRDRRVIEAPSVPRGRRSVSLRSDRRCESKEPPVFRAGAPLAAGADTSDRAFAHGRR
jgi:hypothetical protein